MHFLTGTFASTMPMAAVSLSALIFGMGVLTATQMFTRNRSVMFSDPTRERLLLNIRVAGCWPGRLSCPTFASTESESLSQDLCRHGSAQLACRNTRAEEDGYHAWLLVSWNG